MCGFFNSAPRKLQKQKARQRRPLVWSSDDVSLSKIKNSYYVYVLPSNGIILIFVRHLFYVMVWLGVSFLKSVSYLKNK